ncbi:hypothetical protein [Zoogloea oleivorans]|uniref:hypothetical protein n=1 Tax=Zoogloea oleivorans TaxID=1552750 RepID=UPI0011DF5E97|nr:hypothetical protein [Zoogloea oleivorans]
MTLARTDEAPGLSAEAAFEAFARDCPVAERQQALTTLIRAKLIPKKADDSRFQSGFRALVTATTDQALPAQERLLALAEVVRAAQVVKRLQAGLATALAPAFTESLPPLQALKEADDRLNVARACGLFEAPWLKAYLARSIAEEEQGENARLELATGLLRQSDSIASMLTSIANPLREVHPETEAPGDSLARRLTRILAALRGVIPASELEAGDAVGQALHQLVSVPFRAVGRPQNEKVQTELAKEVMLLTHEVLRTRFSVATDPAMFQAVSYCRQLLGGGSWPSALQDCLSLLIKDIREALILLGRQGVRDQQLLAQLDMLSNFPQRAQAIAREIAERHPEMDEDTRHWLTHGRLPVRRESSNTAQETAAREADESIGLALHAAKEARQAMEGIRNPLMATLDIYEQGLVAVTSDCFTRLEALALQVEAAAHHRGLALYGTPGEQVDFAPKLFTQIGATDRQKVILKQPAVVRVRKDGSVGDVVVKGLVE